MRLTTKGWAIFSDVAVVCGFGIAAAQTDTPPLPPVPEVTEQQDVQLTPAQMLTEANKYLPRMEQGQATVRRQLAQAREQRDVVKTLCLNDKLTQIDVAMRTARDRIASLKSAVGRNDADRSRHEFTVIQVLRDRVRSLVSEANQCIGEETGFIGESQVVVDIDPNIPETDPSEFPDDPLISEPPVQTSPTQ